MIALKFDRVRKSYENGVLALDGLTMEVPRGSLFGFIGLNGAGKTSAIRIMAGLSQQESGTVSLFEQPLERDNVAQKRVLGFVLDEPLYFEWMSVRDYLIWAGMMYDLRRTESTLRTEELIHFFDLDEKADAQIGTCSTGMKKKVSLAAAIIHKPEILVLDEPLEGIDAVAGSAIKETLRLMSASGTTIIITSHVLDTVEKLCTDLAILHKGALVLQCKTADLSLQTVSQRAPASLEELFVDLVSERQHTKRLSWL
jgi:ABC-2 type transport system ATP-binding protein